MNNHQAFVQTILENPEEDAPRLIYADWLEEQGDPRGEFIRVQCELDFISESDPREDALSERKDELLRQHGEEWASALLNRGVREVEFRRGFVEEVSTSAHAFIKHGRRWVESTPLRALSLTRVAGRAEALANCPHLARIEDLHVYDKQVGDREVAALSASPFLKLLTAFGVQGDSFCGIGSRVGDQGLGHLASADWLSGLCRLSVASDGSLGSPGVEALAGSAGTAELTELHLSGTRITDSGASALAGSTSLGKLDRLSVVQGRIRDEGWVSLVTSGRLVGMSRLWLTANRVTGDGFVSLVASPGGDRLEHVSLELNPVHAPDWDALDAILKSRPNLTVSLCGCPIPAEERMEAYRRFGNRVYLDKPARARRKSRVRG